MTDLVSGRVAGKQFCEAIGIDPNLVTELMFGASVTGALWVNVEMRVAGSAVEEITRILAEEHPDVSVNITVFGSDD